MHPVHEEEVQHIVDNVSRVLMNSLSARGDDITIWVWEDMKFSLRTAVRKAIEYMEKRPNLVEVQHVA